MRFLLRVAAVLLTASSVWAQTAVEIQGPPGPAGPPGTVGGDWAQGALAANQTTDIAVGDPIKFASWTGTLTTDPVNYRVTLVDGKLYLITVTIAPAFSNASGEAAFRLYDVTNATAVGPFCGGRGGSGGTTTDAPGTLTYIDATSGERVLELRVADAVDLLEVIGAYTRITVVEIGTTP